MAEPLNVPAAHAEQPTGPVARRAIHPNFWLEPEARHRVTETAAASPPATRMPAQNMSLDAALPLPLAECLGVMDDKIEHLAGLLGGQPPIPPPTRHTHTCTTHTHSTHCTAGQNTASDSPCRCRFFAPPIPLPR